jgi:hypothetical protein
MEISLRRLQTNSWNTEEEDDDESKDEEEEKNSYFCKVTFYEDSKLSFVLTPNIILISLRRNTFA